MKGIVNIFIFLLVPLGCLSQGEFNNWYFGSHCGITFNSGIPVFLPGNPENIGVFLAEVSVSDSAGNLLFFSDGTNLYNRNKVLMPGAYDLLGGGVHAQIIAVQDLTYHNLYYLFTVQDPTYFPEQIIGLRYSVIDMQLDGGLGGIVSGMKNIPLPMGDSVITTLTATRHHNNKYAWVVAYRHGIESQYLAYLIDSSGVNTTPVVSESTLEHPFFGTDVPGFIRISPDGQHLFCTDSLTELCHFNTSTGVATPRFRFWHEGEWLDNDWRGSQEFSIDSRYVYFMTFLGNQFAGHNAIVQYDMINTDSMAFMESRADIGDSCKWILQMAPDWKIYVTDSSGSNLHRINRPSAPGAACDYQRNVLYLEGNLHRSCLPQFLQRYKVYISSSGGQCQDSVAFTSDIWPPADSIRWDFGDPGSGTSNYSDLPNPFHIYSNAGSYQAECRVRHIDKRVDTARVTVVVSDSTQPVLGNDLTICEGESVIFDAGFCVGCSYLWTELLTGTVVGTGQTLTTSEAGHYEAAVTGLNGCTGRDSVWLNTTPVPVVTNTPPAKAICSGELTDIVLTSNAPGATFNWTATLTAGNVTGFGPDSGLVISQILVNQGSSPGEVTYHITPKVGSCIGILSDYAVTVNPVNSVEVSIAASGNNLCAGDAVTFTATPVNGGTNPTYQWIVNGVNAGTNSPIFTYPPLDGDVVTCILTSSIAQCIINNPATSNSVVMAVNPLLPVSVSITESSNPVCSGTAVTFTATPANEGTTPTYQWSVNGSNAGTDSPVFTYLPSDGDVVTCMLTSSIVECITNNPATSNSVVMTVNPILPVSVSITESSNPVCSGTAVTFTATPANEGTTPAYQWIVNGVNAGINNPVFTYPPLDGDVVTCMLTSSIAQCIINNPATSNSVVMTVNPILPVSVSITESSNPVCSGTAVTFTAIPVNGGTTPAYQWIVNGVNAGTNSPVFIYLPSDRDVVTCMLTSSIAQCIINNPATSNSTTMTVNPILPVSVSITASSNPVCSGTPVTFTAAPANEGTAPNYQWRVNGSNAGTNNPVFTYTPSNGDLVTCMLTSSIAQCIINNPATSNMITMVEIETPQVSFTRCFDSVTTIDAIPIHLKGGIPLGGTYSGPGVNPTTGVFTPSAAGAGTKVITYSYTNVHSCTAAGSITIIVQIPSPFTCGGMLTDIRDGNVYRTLQVGSLCWMGSNLNYGTRIQSSTHQSDNCIAEKYCSKDQESNCYLGKAVYQWDELIQYGNTAGPGYQGVCPPGWHIPSVADYQELIDANQGSSLAGTFLKDLYLIPRGFEALLQGMAYLNTAWAFTSGELPAGTLFWTSSPGSGNRIVTRGMNNRNQSVSQYESSRVNAFAVRCVRN